MGATLLELLEQWHQKEEYDKVAEALQNRSPEEMDDNLYGQLARAMSCLFRYEEALEVLDRVSEQGRDDTWWYRRGYALFYLRRYEEARQALEVVVQMNPLDSEARDFIQDCDDMMLRQRGEDTFLNRVERFWDGFRSREEELRQLIDCEKTEEANRLVESLLDVRCFGREFQPEKVGDIYRLTLSPEGQPHRRSMMEVWRSVAPGALDERWEFCIQGEAEEKQEADPYTRIPDPDSDRLRDDIIMGYNEYPEVIREFYNGESELFREAMEDGAVFGYLFFDHSCLDQEERIRLNEQIMYELEPGCGFLFTIMGQSAGIYDSYIDLLCYDYAGTKKILGDLLNDHPQLREFGFGELVYNGFVDDLRVNRPRYYGKWDRVRIRDHITKYFGSIQRRLLDYDDEKIPVEIAVIPPSPKRDYYILTTFGMGANRMNVPRNLWTHGLDRAELFIELPKTWDPLSSDNTDRWPVRWLRYLARLPLLQDTWLGWGHTVPGDGPLADNTQLSGVMLTSAAEYGSEAGECALEDGSIVTFYRVVPLYPEEMDFKIEHGAEALVDLLKEEGLPTMVDVNRPNVCDW